MGREGGSLITSQSCLFWAIDPVFCGLIQAGVDYTPIEICLLYHQSRRNLYPVKVNQLLHPCEIHPLNKFHCTSLKKNRSKNFSPAVGDENL